MKFFYSGKVKHFVYPMQALLLFVAIGYFLSYVRDTSGSPTGLSMVSLVLMVSLVFLFMATLYDFADSIKKGKNEKYEKYEGLPSISE